MAKKSSGIGLRIRGLRISRGVSQGDLAKATSMNQSVLNRIEKGTRPARDAEISAIANFFLNYSTGKGSTLSSPCHN